MAAQDNNSAAAAVSGFFKSIGGFFADFGTAVVKGDAFVKLSLIWMGAGYAKRKQYVKAVLMTLLEIAVIVFSVKFAMQYVPKFSTLGTVKMEKVFNMKTMKSEFNDYDNSFTILLFSLFSFVVWFLLNNRQPMLHTNDVADLLKSKAGVMEVTKFTLAVQRSGIENDMIMDVGTVCVSCY